MTREAYATIKSQLDFRDGILSSFAIITPGAVSLGGRWALLEQGGLLAYLVAQVQLAIVITRWAS